jgi:glycosyltransferase involved in cell wall biosynthesis
MKLAFVYDWFDKKGGAERLLQALHDAYPDAVWYTSYRDSAKTPWANGWDVQTSFIQRLPTFVKRSRVLSLFLYPLAFESFDFSRYDVVVSITSSFAKGIITAARTRHICYLLTPTRWLWDDAKYQVHTATFSLIRCFTDAVRRYLKVWDFAAAQRADEIIGISREVVNRCYRYYSRSCELVYPPFDPLPWQDMVRSLAKRQQDFAQHFKLRVKGYYLVVSRLEPYKRIDLAISAYALRRASAKDDNVALVIVGNGSCRRALQKQTQQLGLENVIFLNEVSDEELAWLYANARALVMPQEEDFGYTACEAIACLCPVVCFAKGGQSEIVRDGVDGIFFSSQTAESISDALARLTTFTYNNRSHENSHLCRWGRDTFVATLSEKISKTV